MLKTCKECEEEKVIKDFYKGQGECKECTKARVRKYRQDNLEKVMEYDRNRPNAKERNEFNKSNHKKKMEDPEYRAKLNENHKEWRENNVVTRAAHILVGNSIRDGRLTKQPCEVCGEINVDAHHDDYTKPLEVRWLCRKHHAEHHKREREVERKS